MRINTGYTFESVISFRKSVIIFSF